MLQSLVFYFQITVNLIKNDFVYVKLHYVYKYIFIMSDTCNTTSIQQLNVYLTVKMEVFAHNLMFVIAHQAGMETFVK